MYKDQKFEVKPLAEIRADIREARQIYGAAETVFLGDSDNLVHDRLPEIVAFIREVFPETRRITSYARAKTVVRRRVEFLERVRSAGLDRLHFGLESGDAVVLERMCKGTEPEDMIQAGQKAMAAGFQVSFYVLCGAGGTDRWRQHAEASASVLNASGSDYIRLRTLTVQYGTPLDQDLMTGVFELTPPLERLREVRTFIDRLMLSACFLASDHLSNYLWEGDRIIYRGVAGELPDEKPRLLREVDRAIASIQASGGDIRDSNRLYREGIIYSL
jgi:radical SAM superfamily enzyme YgiQ (UPF0313 family)